MLKTDIKTKTTELEALERKADQMHLKTLENHSASIIYLPKYKINEGLKLYEEIEQPKDTIYM